LDFRFGFFDPAGSSVGLDAFFDLGFASVSDGLVKLLAPLVLYARA
jgi:hypothetical protein